MLILSRKINESIMIDGRIKVKVMRCDGDVVKLGIAAPDDVPVHRQEVYEGILKNNRQALTRGRRPLPKLPAQHPQSAKNKVPEVPVLSSETSQPLAMT